MDYRRKTNADLESKRGLFFRIGLIVSLGLALLAFDWTTSYNPQLLASSWSGPPLEPPVTIMPPSRPDPPRPVPPAPSPLPPKANNGAAPPVVVPDDRTLPPESPIYRIDEKPEPYPETDTDIPVLGADRMPEFKGGDSALVTYIRDHIRYAGRPGRERPEGTVFVRFVVGRDGRIRDVVLQHGVSDLLDEEALRVVRTMPAWEPGVNKGFPVSVTLTLPIRFRLLRD